MEKQDLNNSDAESVETLMCTGTQTGWGRGWQTEWGLLICWAATLPCLAFGLHSYSSSHSLSWLLSLSSLSPSLSLPSLLWPGAPLDDSPAPGLVQGPLTNSFPCRTMGEENYFGCYSLTNQPHLSLAKLSSAHANSSKFWLREPSVHKTEFYVMPQCMDG